MLNEVCLSVYLTEGRSDGAKTWDPSRGHEHMVDREGCLSEEWYESRQDPI